VQYVGILISWCLVRRVVHSYVANVFRKEFAKIADKEENIVKDKFIKKESKSN